MPTDRYAGSAGGRDGSVAVILGGIVVQVNLDRLRIDHLEPVDRLAQAIGERERNVREAPGRLGPDPSQEAGLDVISVLGFDLVKDLT